MYIEEIKKLSLSKIKELYRDYLQQNNYSKRTINTSSNDAFYLLNNNNEIDFWELLKSNDFDYLSKKYLEETLIKNSKGNVKSNLSGYCYHIKKFRQFVLGDIKCINNTVVKENIEDKSNNRIVSGIILPTPSNEQVETYLEQWNTLENYKLQEVALEKMFKRLIPGNNEISDILLKTATLNDFYSTNIFSIYDVAKRIHELKIDNRLINGDVELVNDIKTVVINGKVKNFYSFATKYCSHHNPIDYPIYDSYVDKVLCYFRSKDNFTNFKNEELKDYKKFKSVLLSFREFYKLQKYTIKELDKYLWLLGKEYFPKNYKNKN